MFKSSQGDAGVLNRSLDIDLSNGFIAYGNIWYHLSPSQSKLKIESTLPKTNIGTWGLEIGLLPQKERVSPNHHFSV